jgi:hypothetical protein
MVRRTIADLIIETRRRYLDIEEEINRITRRKKEKRREKPNDA